MSVVVTNDDGILSPLLHAFLRELSRQSWCRDLRPVIPKDEQSWVAQSVTRFRHLNVEKKNLFDGVSALIVDGSPADCASLGITELFPQTARISCSPESISERTRASLSISTLEQSVARGKDSCSVAVPSRSR